jgi:hypothetical protein
LPKNVINYDYTQLFEALKKSKSIFALPFRLLYPMGVGGGGGTETDKTGIPRYMAFV